ncbi:TetR/AcrR family transcriptional regulator [Clostridia bacterium]|nr:TetR/AcrR family transcriptional regulator [Clostridia bacterium]
MPKIIDYPKTRKNILLKSLPLFVDLGYQKVRLEDVGRAASMGRTSLYQYYKNKENLYCDMILMVVDKIKERVDEMIAMNDLTLLQKLAWLDEALLKDFGKSSISILFMEFLILAKRDKDDSYNELINHITEVEDYISRKLDEEVSKKALKDDEWMDLMQISFVLSMIQQLGLEDRNLHDSMMHAVGRKGKISKD